VRTFEQDEAVAHEAATRLRWQARAQFLTHLFNGALGQSQHMGLVHDDRRLRHHHLHCIAFATISSRAKAREEEVYATLRPGEFRRPPGS